MTSDALAAAEGMASALRTIRDRNKARAGYYDSEVQRICRAALKAWATAQEASQ